MRADKTQKAKLLIAQVSENTFNIKVSHSPSQTCQANASGHNEVQLGDTLGVAGAIPSPE